MLTDSTRAFHTKRLNKSSFSVSSSKISRAEDRALDAAQPQKTSGMAGIAVRNGPVDDDMDLDAPNGVKRKSRSAGMPKVSYKDESDSDSEPLVGVIFLP